MRGKPYGRFTSSSRRQRPSRHQSAELCPPGCPHDRTHHDCPFAQGVPSFGLGVQCPSFVRTTGSAVCGSVTDGADLGSWVGAGSGPSPTPASAGAVNWTSVSGKERRWGSQATNPNAQTPSHTLVIGIPFASASRACSPKRSVVFEQLRASFGTCSTFRWGILRACLDVRTVPKGPRSHHLLATVRSLHRPISGLGWKASFLPNSRPTSFRLESGRSRFGSNRWPKMLLR